MSRGRGRFRTAEHDEVRAGDLLPTADAISAAKQAAAQVCCEMAAANAWADLAAAKACLDLIPYVALEALELACPEVRLERLARCVGLDPLDGVDELRRLMGWAGWPSDAVAAVMLAIGGGR